MLYSKHLTNIYSVPSNNPYMLSGSQAGNGFKISFFSRQHYMQSSVITHTPSLFCLWKAFLQSKEGLAVAFLYIFSKHSTIASVQTEIRVKRKDSWHKQNFLRRIRPTLSDIQNFISALISCHTQLVMWIYLASLLPHNCY